MFPVKIYLISTNSFFNFVSRYFQVECVRKFIVLPKEFSIPGGELGPTLKLKRYLVAEMYQKEIDEMYKWRRANVPKRNRQIDEMYQWNRTRVPKKLDEMYKWNWTNAPRRNRRDVQIKSNKCTKKKRMKCTNENEQMNEQETKLRRKVQMKLSKRNPNKIEYYQQKMEQLYKWTWTNFVRNQSE